MPSVEQMEHAVHQGADTFAAKATELEREGASDAAQVLWVLADGEPNDFHKMGAMLQVQMANIGQDSRDRAMQALHGCALHERDAGRDETAYMIAVALEELGAIFGLPGERD